MGVDPAVTGESGVLCGAPLTGAVPLPQLASFPSPREWGIGGHVPLAQNLAVMEKPTWGCGEPTRQEACSKFRIEFDESDVAPASSPYNPHIPQNH